MKKVLKAIFSPTKLIIGTAFVLAIGLAVGKINVMPAHVSAAATLCDSEETKCGPTCRDASQDGISIPIPDGYTANSDGFCVPIDLCPNIQGNQAVIPSGYHLDSNGDCVQDPPPQVLSDSTTVSDPGTPQVLAATTFAGK
ncbi:MAG TPA: hypothetical protein VLF90_02675 [Patescibacteria group bacterium]|nr:hypothetical protein [Patescibacteria group bacterium]